MSVPIYFPSLLNPGLAYTRNYDIDTYGHRSGVLAHRYGSYRTFGDGLTPHSGTSYVGIALFTDFCLSLASFILAQPLASPALVAIRSDDLGLEPVRRETYDFLCSLRFKDKPQWYSLPLRKVSNSQEKAYDNRWRKVPSDADATPASGLRLYFADLEYATLLRRYAVNRFWRELSNGFFLDEEVFDTWREQIAGDHVQAWDALRLAVDFASTREHAHRLLDFAIQNSTPLKAAA